MVNIEMYLCDGESCDGGPDNGTSNHSTIPITDTKVDSLIRAYCVRGYR